VKRSLLFLIAAVGTCLGAFISGIASAAAGPGVVIVCSPEASPLESFAAREVRRYVYLRTGKLLPTAESAERVTAIVVARKDRGLVMALANDSATKTLLNDLGPQDYVLKTRDDEDGFRVVYLVGGSEVSTLYAAYRFAEHLGVRFYLHGDVVPDTQAPLGLPQLDEEHSPLFELRGIQPFHDFPEGPDWWNTDNYKAIIAQLPKLRMNFIGLHTYPNVEPTVWIGLEQDVGPDGRVSFSYPTRYFNTALTVGWGFSAKRTTNYACGGAALFDRDDYGSEIVAGLTPQPDSLEGSNEVFNRTGEMFREAFTLARLLGVKTCVGTQTPLVVPTPVQERLNERQRSVQDLYRGIFTRIMKAHPLDYYWFWTPETWTWQDVSEEDVERTVEDLRTAHAAAKQLGAPFELATCGWVLGPQYDRALFAKVLPKDITLSCISRHVGHDPVEPGFAEVEGRGKWAIPWLEDDPAMTSPQLWVGRMRRDARDALKYGCTGLMGIHWRTRIIAPNVAALAQAAWDQSDWPEVTVERSGPVGGTVARFPNTDVADTDDDTLYRSVRYNMAAYRVVVPNGTYTVTLRFCEPHYKETGKRVFDVKLEEQTVIDHLDVFARAGRNRALDYVFENLDVCDGVLDVDFVKRMEFPCIAAIAVEGSEFSQKINCGGEDYEDYTADLPSLPPHLPADDFYADWALHEFGPQVAEEAADILSAVDGRLPRPSDWVGGPGGYRPDDRPWEKVAKDYAFVDEFATLRPRVVGSGNQARFDYWLNNLQFLQATAHMRCVWGEYNNAMKAVKAGTSAREKSRRARERALPVRKELIAAVERAYGHLLATVTTTGAMGTVCNLEQHTFPGMLDEPGKELAALLGEPLPGEAQLSMSYNGAPRLIVPARRSCLLPGEGLTVTVILLDELPAQSGAVHWRPLGAGTWIKEPIRRVGRTTYTAQISEDSIGGSDIEYYIRMLTAKDETLRWPPSAPAINQTVVIGPRASVEGSWTGGSEPWADHGIRDGTY